MPEQKDAILLREFSEMRSEAAFGALVERHIALVHGVALRRTGNPDAAEEIAQAVFIILARKAASLDENVVLSGWLYRAARLTSANYLRTEMRRQRREQEAALQSTGPEHDPWPQIAPLLEEAMATLRERDRNAIILRFFENKSFSEVGAVIGSSEDATRVRVNRALEKLRKFFGKRGIILSAIVIASALSNNALADAPPSLIAKASLISAQSYSTTTNLALVTRTLRSLNQTRLKFAALVAIVVILNAILLPLVLYRNKDHAKPRANMTPALASGNETSTTLAAATPPAATIREMLSPATLFTLNTPPGALVIQPDGKIIAGASLGGFFVDEESGVIGWYGRAAMRFETNGALDRTFSSDVGRTEYTTAGGSRLGLLASNRIFVSGFFHNVEGKPLHGHAILMPDGSVDESFNPWRDGETNVNHRMDYPRLAFSSAVLRDGTIAVMSRPVEGTNPQAAYLWSAYRIDETGRIAWPALTNLDVGRPARLILTHGDTPYGPFPEVPLELIRYAVRLPEGGGILATREPPFGGGRGSFKKFDQNWKMVPNFTNEFSAHRGDSDITLHLQRDGKILVAGIVGTLNGEEFPGLVRLDTNGAVDRTFWCETGNSPEGRVMDVAVQEDNRIVICGFFTQVNGTPCEHIARLNPDGSLDKTFQSPFLSMKEFGRKRFLRVPRLSKTAASSETTDSSSSINRSGTAEASADLERIHISSMQREAGGAVVSFRGKPRGIYILQSKDAMTQPDWNNVSTNAAGANGVGTLRDVNANNHPTRFYRIAKP